MNRAFNTRATAFSKALKLPGLLLGLLIWIPVPSEGTEGIGASCIEYAQHGIRKGHYEFPEVLMQSGDSVTLGSYIHMEDRYLLSVLPPLLNLKASVKALQSSWQTDPRLLNGLAETETPLALTSASASNRTYEVLLVHLPIYGKEGSAPTEKIRHSAATLLSGTQQQTLEIVYHKRDDLGFDPIPYRTHVVCTVQVTPVRSM